MHGDHLIFKFKGVDTIFRCRTAGWRRCRYPMEARAQVADGEYYQSDLVGASIRGRRLIGLWTAGRRPAGRCC